MPARIVAEFLTGAKLRKMFSHLCNNASGQVQFFCAMPKFKPYL